MRCRVGHDQSYWFRVYTDRPDRDRQSFAKHLARTSYLFLNRLDDKTQAESVWRGTVWSLRSQSESDARPIVVSPTQIARFRGCWAVAEYLLSPHWSGRANLDLLRTHIANEGQSRLRLVIGLTYTFGARESSYSARIKADKLGCSDEQAEWVTMAASTLPKRKDNFRLNAS